MPLQFPQLTGLQVSQGNNFSMVIPFSPPNTASSNDNVIGYSRSAPLYEALRPELDCDPPKNASKISPKPPPKPSKPAPPPCAPDTPACPN